MGKSGLKLSALTLGTLWFGSKVDEATAREIVDRALAAGVNCIDTADIYGKDRWDTPERGPSEEIVGRALKGRRQSVVLATKVAALTGPGANDRGLSRKHIVEGVHESLRRLQTDYIDIYYLHEPDYDHPAGGVARGAQRSGAPGQDPLHRAVQLLRLAGLQGAVATPTRRTSPASTASRWSTTCSPATASWR